MTAANPHTLPNTITVPRFSLPYKNKRGLIHSAILDRASRKLSLTLDLGKDKGVTIEYQCKQSPMRIPHDTFAPPCAFEAISGNLFEFTPTYIGGEKYGYKMWNTSPSIGKGLPYYEYLGRKGKLTGEVVPSRYGNYFVFHKAVLDNCEVVYTRVSKENPIYMGAILAKDLEKAKALIGKPIWINNVFVARSQELITSDPKISYPTHNIEKLIVLDLSLVQYGHARGSGSFFLKVKKGTGEEGLIKFNDRYFYVTDPIPAGTPRDIRTAIEQQKIKNGMTEQQARLSWGEPKKVNKTVGSRGIHEQWVYEKQYLYFENGKIVEKEGTALESEKM